MLFMLLISSNVRAANSEVTQPPASVYSKPIDENATDEKTCARKWERYHKSQDCFAPYHNVNGSMKPGAFENCIDIKSPIECPL